MICEVCEEVIGDKDNLLILRLIKYEDYRKEIVEIQKERLLCAGCTVDIIVDKKQG